MSTVISRRGTMAAGKYPLITDTFSETDGTNLNGKATTTGGKTWAVSPGSLDVNTGKARVTTVPGTSSTAVINAGYANIDMSATITTGANGIDGLIFRYTDGSNYLRLDIGNSTDNLYLISNVAGTETDVATFAIAGLTIGNVATYRVLAVGTSIKIYRDAVLKIDTTTVTNPSGVKHGIIGFSTNTRFDDFSLIRA